MIAVALGLALFAPVAFAQEKSVLDYSVKDIDGKDVNLADYKGKVILVVNVASKCGLTPQYEGLEALYEKYKDQGFVILGFPANEFGAQEPGSNAEIKEFCKLNYDVSFPMFSKVVVKGQGIHPLFQYLTSKDTNPKYAGEIQWNFNKFLIDREGNVIGRFEPRTKPESEEVAKAIETALAKK
jgi:glutathione peroxidase